MQASAIFTKDATWDGGAFELRLIFDPGAADTSAYELSAWSALWSHPSLEGCVPDRFPEPGSQTRIAPQIAAQHRGRPWYGVATLPTGMRTGCRAHLFDSSEPADPPEIHFGVPMGALAGAYPVGAYPIADGLPLAWRSEVSAWLAEIAQAVYNQAPFRFGMIEHEATLDGVTTTAVRKVPGMRWEGYLWPDDGLLHWYPPTEGAAIKLRSPAGFAGSAPDPTRSREIEMDQPSPDRSPGPEVLWRDHSGAESPVIERGEIASAWRRGLALLIDLFILLGAVIAASYLFGERSTQVIVRDGELYGRTIATLSAWEVRGVLLGWYGYLMTTERLFGKTLGKRVVGIAVVRDDWSPLNVRAAVLRQLTHLVPVVAAAHPGLSLTAGQVAVYPLGALIALLSEDRRRVGDRLAGILVVRRTMAPETGPAASPITHERS
jgi:uncharacterized RDD family membrane protein YckC